MTTEQIQFGTWYPIKDAPRDGSALIVIGNSELALAWYEPEAGASWKVMNIPGRGVRLADFLATSFHSYCRATEFHRAVNQQLNPVFYGLAPSSSPERSK